MVFRSILIPLFATLGYLLSCGAAFGVIALVYHYGYFANLLSVAKTGPIISFAPVIIMGILFGLAMDYQVFIVSRIREEYVLSGDTKLAVKQGFIKGSRVVLAAALIMLSVFLLFVTGKNIYIKPIALGLTVGVFVDALLVRMTLMPALIYLFGNKIWWMPSWLENILPAFDVEGDGLRQKLQLVDFEQKKSFKLTDKKNKENYASVSSDLILQKQLPNNEVLNNKYSFSYKMGKVHILRAKTPFILERLILAVSGRNLKISGKLKTLGFVLPIEASLVRKKTVYIDFNESLNNVKHIKKEIILLLKNFYKENPQIIFVNAHDLESKQLEFIFNELTDWVNQKKDKRCAFVGLTNGSVWQRSVE
jgi:RND superfamily putative drug exporter